MTVQLKGVDGIRARIEELRAKMGAQALAESGQVSGMVTAGNPFSGEIAPMPVNAPGMILKPISAPGNLKAMIEKAALEAGVDPGLFDALVATESSYDPNARSRAGALGLSQLMPATAESLGVTNPFDPEQNLRGGAQYLAQMIRKFGDAKLALAAYNAGPGAVAKYGGIPPFKETQNYVDRVMNRFNGGRP